MLKGSTKKFFIFVCIVLAMVATLGMTPATQRKKVLNPIKNLYNKKNSGNSAANAELDNQKDKSDSPKVIVVPDNAEKAPLNVEEDPEHPAYILPVVDAETKVVDDTEDTSVANAKAEAILDGAPV